jgi:acyl-CoA oxidase
VSTTTCNDQAAFELAAVLFSDGFEESHQPWRTLMASEPFRHRAGLDFAERVELAYQRLRLVDEAVKDLDGFVADPRPLAAMHEWAAVVDGSLTTLAGIHYNLFLGTLADHGRPLEKFAGAWRIGTFLCTELGYGNNAAQLETVAVYDGEGFVLHSPSAAAWKFMPNTSSAGGPKSALVAARLMVDGADEGVCLFLVPMETPGVHVQLLQPKVGPPVDHCLTRFDRVRLQREALLQGPQVRLDEHGRVVSRYNSRRQRFLASIGRVTTGKLCMTGSVVGGARYAVALAVRYAHARRTAALTGGESASVAAWSHRSHHARLLEVVAATFAATLLHRAAVARWRECPGPEAERFVAMAKAWITWWGRDIAHECRERCGAQGLFPVNGLAENLAAAEGTITAEGDNLAIWVKAAGQVLMGNADPIPQIPVAERSLTDPGFLQAGLVEIERIWKRRSATALRARTGSTGTSRMLERWNTATGPALQLVQATADRVAAQTLLEAAHAAPSGLARDLLLALHRLLALRMLAPSSGDLLLAGHFSADHVEQLQATRDQTAAFLQPHGLTLIGSFLIPEEQMAQHPIGRGGWDQILEAVVTFLPAGSTAGWPAAPE